MGLSHAINRFVLLPSAIGVVCCACSASSEPQGTLRDTLSVELETVQIDAVPTEAEPTAEETAADAAAKREQALAAQDTAYQEGINLASGAASLGQSAVSPDDWGLVASRWRRAAEQLKQVSAGHKEYAIAQTKIAEYLSNAEYATKQVSSLQASARAPLPARPAPSAKNPATRQSDTARSPANPAAPTPVPTSQTSARPTRTPASRSQSTAANAAAASAARRSTQSSTPTDTRSAVRVPVVRRLHGTPVVRVTFNDSRTYEMILDTGASRTLITRAMANELGIVPTDQMIAATASAAQVTFDLGRMNSISIGDVRLSNAQVSIGDSVDVGLLGNDFLQGYDVTIRNREVELSRAR